MIPYTQEDIRFTSKDGHLYLFVLQTPSSAVSVKSLGRAAEFAQPIRSISLVGSNEPVRWQQNEEELVIEKPAQFPSADVVSYQVTFQ